MAIDLPSRQWFRDHAGVMLTYEDDAEEWEIVAAYVRDELKTEAEWREGMMEGIVTSVGSNNMIGHGNSGPWAFVTIYGDFEPFDTMLVMKVSDGSADVD